MAVVYYSRNAKPIVTYQDLSAPAAGDMFWSMATSRDGCYIANGADYAIADEPDLYAAIGTAFNTQINPTTGSAWAAPSAGRFRVPDMRGLYARGAGTASGADALAVGAYQSDQNKQHYHGQVTNNSGGNAGGPGAQTAPFSNNGLTNVSSQGVVGASPGILPEGGNETRVKSRGGNWFIRRFNATYVAIGTGVAKADRAGLAPAMSNLVPMQSRVAVTFGITSPTTLAASCAHFYQLPSGQWMMWFSFAFSWGSQSPTSIAIGLTGVPLPTDVQTFSGMFLGAATPTEAYADVNGLYLSSSGGASTGAVFQGTIRLASKPTI